ncbi:ribose-phosphate diphosphokinase [Rhodoblastus acidophilus]|uniref:ribose-phosphate diphosphokinase n=1 Tax=Candidatus Rhodoblastus alkanivorans TaxID=2954117 RepID=A0ABS9Z6C4_9HYPH|nr:ribose-phosphate diphosphokinase [Candidatus Rhodoblastus alkanivorans]MCI4679167.1 ribose-phosphate diphosphokinase [Candidatus Rhodoblastus alkanivorans]MCI4683163.1 ribose-phosphate diphosphokinase [Candidatus Rhodoblastus alkanivorans]MDI4640474.1 ribose-phosphate diphosphokinase [Rhodoblastus acidophilus]
MTTLAIVDPPLRRLFSRLDFAPRPVQQGLSELLANWEALRAGAVAPALAAAEETVPANGFVFARDDSERDFLLRRASIGLERLTGLTEAGARLSASPEPRHAVRLRRLFETVLNTGEPVLAEFSAETHEEAGLVVDLLAAPLASSDGRIVGILGGCELRRSLGGEPPLRRHAARIDEPVIFALSRMAALAETVAHSLGTTVSAHEERRFEDGEHKIRPLVCVRNRDAYVFADLGSSGGESVNDKLCKLLFFIGALKQSAAARVNVIAPYLCYGRKERQTKPRDPVATRYLAQMFEAVGCDCVITIAAHDLAAFQNAFRRETEHLDFHALFARTLAPHLRGEEVAVVTPDPGGEKRAELFRETLERILDAPVTKALVDKKRSMGKVTGDLFAGDVADRTAIIIDDMIGTGGTMSRAALACRRHGARRVIAAAAHGLFSPGAENFLRDPSIDRIWVADSLPLPALTKDAIAQGKLRIVATAPLLADVIHALHSGGSINDLQEHAVSPFPGA